MKGFRWLGLPAVAALTVLLFALTAGIGSARTAVAPNNTAPPTISGKAQVGELLKADRGTWTGTAPITYTYAWRICDANGALRPEELTELIGRRLRITLPEGVPGAPSA